MDIIFPSITNNPNPIEHDQTRSEIVIDHNKPFKTLKGSPVKPGRIGGPAIPEVGSIYRSNGALPYKPSYSKIGNETILSDPIRDLKHKIIIEKDSVFFNNHCIAIAPEKHNTGKKFTSAQKTTFLKAVVFGIIPTEINKYQKDTNGKMVIVSVPDDLYFQELITKYPASNDNQDIETQQIMRDETPVKEAVKDDLVLPEALNAYTPEAITGYPVIEPQEDHFEYFELLHNGMFNLGSSMLDNEIDTAFMDEIEKESIGEMYTAFTPIIMQKWTMPHLRLSIIEECVPA